MLNRLQSQGLGSLDEAEEDLDRYLDGLTTVDPDNLTHAGALAFWLNLYNATALQLVRQARRAGADSVLRLRGAFDQPGAVVAGTPLSLNDIEHGKLRRFGDPRIHFAIVCGSLSCPTLRYEPFREAGLDRQLEDQSRTFFASSGVQRTGADRVLLSRILLWYGGDFTRPHRMPTWLPGRRTEVFRATLRWMPDAVRSDLPDRPRIGFLDYDWALGCAIG